MRYGYRVLAEAVYQRDFKMAEILLETRAGVILATFDGTLLLNDAIGTGDLDIVGLLLDYGAKVDRDPDDDCAMPLGEAVAQGSPLMVKKLLDHGADALLSVAARGRTLLELADASGVPAIRGLIQGATEPSNFVTDFILQVEAQGTVDLATLRFSTMGGDPDSVPPLEWDNRLSPHLLRPRVLAALRSSSFKSKLMGSKLRLLRRGGVALNTSGATLLDQFFPLG